MATLWKALHARLSTLPADERNFTRFRRFLAMKVMAPFVFESGLWARPSISPTALLAVGLVALTFHRRFWRFGLLGVLAFSLLECWQSWPFTLNHIALEAVILFFLAVDVDPQAGETRLGPARKILVLMLSVWFFSGIQKAAHGYFWSGETLGLEMLAGESHLGRNLRLLAGVFGVNLPEMHCCGIGPVPWPAALPWVLLAMGISTILVEVGLPLAVFLPRWRAWAIAGLFLFQLQVGLLSGELDFAFTAFAILFLFTPRLGRFVYPLLAIGYLGVSPWL